MDNKNNRKKLYEYNNVLKSIDDCYRNIAKRYGFSEAAFWTLYTLRMEPGNITQSDVCTVLYQPKQTVNSALKKLESRGYLRMESMSGDRRNKLLSLTARGEELLRLAVEPTLSMEERAFLRLTPEERRTFLDLSHRYLNAIREEAEPLLAQPAPEEWEEV